MANSKRECKRKSNKTKKPCRYRDPNSTVAFRIVADNCIPPANMHIPDYIKRSRERKEDGKPEAKPNSLSSLDLALKEMPKAAEPTEDPATAVTAVVTPEKVAAQFYVTPKSKGGPKTN